MKEDFSKNICIVVRAMKERTVDVCEELLRSQAPSAVFERVGGKPFVETLADSLKAGVASAREWTLCVDADVFAFPGAVEALWRDAQKLPENFIEQHPVVLDRFFGGWRPAGVRIYRTAFLPKALDVLSKQPSLIRPESSMLITLSQMGCPWQQTALEFGLHDFEQYPRDIYRKNFTQAHKHSQFAEKLLAYWNSRKNEHPDFELALMGFRDGLAYKGEVEIDAGAKYFEPKTSLEKYEKPPLKKIDAAKLLREETKRIESLGKSVAPAWDWVEADWFYRDRKWDRIGEFVRDLAAKGLKNCYLEKADGKSRLFAFLANLHGIKVEGVLDSKMASYRERFHGVKLLKQRPFLRQSVPIIGRDNRDMMTLVSK